MPCYCSLFSPGTILCRGMSWQSIHGTIQFGRNRLNILNHAHVLAEGHLVDLGVTGLIYYVVGKLLAAPLPPTG